MGRSPLLLAAHPLSVMPPRPAAALLPPGTPGDGELAAVLAVSLVGVAGLLSLPGAGFAGY